MGEWIKKMKEVVPVFFKKYFWYFIVAIGAIIVAGLFM